MMKKCMFLLALIFMFASGCANTAANLQRETARYIRDIHPEDVQVSNVKRGMTEVKWNATTPKGNYNCSADDMLRRVYCVENK